MKIRLHSIGNEQLMKNEKIGFLCSRNPSPEAVLEAYVWAREQCDLGSTVISGFHSPVEQDVYNILARRGSKLIHVLARSLPRRFTPTQHILLKTDRLLIVTVHDDHENRATRKSCLERNELVKSLADTTFYTNGLYPNE